MVLERLGLGKLLEKTKVIKHVYTILVLCVGWTFFRVGDVGLTLQYLKRMFLPWMYTASGFAVQELVTNRAFFLAACGILGCGVLQKCAVKISPRAEKFKNSTAELIFCMLLLAYSVMLMVSSTYQAFIYFRF